MACSEEWECSKWDYCINGKQTRTCTEKNNCETGAGCGFNQLYGFSGDKEIVIDMGESNGKETSDGEMQESSEEVQQDSSTGADSRFESP